MSDEAKVCIGEISSFNKDVLKPTDVHEKNVLPDEKG